MNTICSMCGTEIQPSLPVGSQQHSASHQASCYGEECATSMFLYMLIFMAYHSSRWIPRKQRVKFQIVNAVFVALVLVPQFYVMGRPKSSRYCGQPLLNNLAASIALSFIASGLSVLFTLMDPVPQSLWACCHVFGLLTCGQGLCTAVLTLTAAACARTTPELYYASLSLTAASIFSTGFFAVRVGVRLSAGRRGAAEAVSGRAAQLSRSDIGYSTY